jgi:hypothetical protein
VYVLLTDTLGIWFKDGLAHTGKILLTASTIINKKKAKTIPNFLITSFFTFLKEKTDEFYYTRVF